MYRYIQIILNMGKRKNQRICTTHDVLFNSKSFRFFFPNFKKNLDIKKARMPKSLNEWKYINTKKSKIIKCIIFSQNIIIYIVPKMFKMGQIRMQMLVQTVYSDLQNSYLFPSYNFSSSTDSRSTSDRFIVSCVSQIMNLANHHYNRI